MPRQSAFEKFKAAKRSQPTDQETPDPALAGVSSVVASVAVPAATDVPEGVQAFSMATGDTDESSPELMPEEPYAAVPTEPMPEPALSDHLAE